LNQENLTQENSSLLKFLGGKAGFQFDNTSSFIYEPETKEFFLIDCGEDVFDKLYDFGYLKKEEVCHFYIAITHMHSDHVGSLGALVHHCEVEGIACHIYFPSSFILKQWLQNIDLHENENLKIFGDVTNTREIDFGPVQIKPEPTIHTGKFPEYGYHIQIKRTPEKLIYYSGDYNGQKPTLESLLTNLLSGEIHELYLDIGKGNPVHLDIDQLLGKIDTMKVTSDIQKKIYMMHLDSKMEKLAESWEDSGYSLNFVKPLQRKSFHKEKELVHTDGNKLVIQSCGSNILQDVALILESPTIESIEFNFVNTGINQIKKMLHKSSLGNLILYLFYMKMSPPNSQIKHITLQCSDSIKHLLNIYLAPMNVPLQVLNLENF
jgi:phosphoribosyl 1,2-cyclic phosphodiesterase